VHKRSEHEPYGKQCRNHRAKPIGRDIAAR
jgi:hypothetical protein